MEKSVMLDKAIINQCTVILTRKCNLRCDFCYAKDAGYYEGDKVSYEDLKKIVDFCCDAKVKYIFFTGGEPLLYPNLNDILVYIKEKRNSTMTAIATNGILFENFQLCKNIVDSGLDYIDVSIKGKDSRNWVDITGYDGYIKQQKAIKNLSMLGIEFTCSMVITLKNIYYLCDSVRIALECGAKQFSFTFVIDNDKSDRKSVDTKTYIEKHNPFKLVEAFISQMEQLNSITTEWWIEYSFPLCVYTEKQLDLLKGKMATPCQIHKRNAITFDTQLNLLPCDMYFDRKIGKLGEDFTSTEDYFKLKNNINYKNTIEDINKLPSDKCIECKYLDRCYGGCPVLWNHCSFDELSTYKEKLNIK